jgi:hypothetical protein
VLEIVFRKCTVPNTEEMDGGQRKNHNIRLHNWYFLPIIISLTTSWNVRLAPMEEINA